jgi:meso-butanediol dehydrogenase/(S,S)-butanediol dehydrogenase/diacetyl reductase
VADAVSVLGGLDVLVLAHGVGGSAPVGEDSPDAWDAVLRINLTGAFLVARAALPHLEARRGAIVTVASTNAWVAGPGWASYCASKAGLAMLTASIANDYGPRGVRANCVCPGWVRTPMADGDMDEIAPRWGTDREARTPDELLDSAAPACGARRDRRGDRVSGGPEASYVNGATIPLDGGASVVDGTSVPYHAGPAAPSSP